jgi:hypothetical protein
VEPVPDQRIPLRHVVYMRGTLVTARTRYKSSYRMEDISEMKLMLQQSLDIFSSDVIQL